MCWESPFHNCVASSWRAIGNHVRIHCTSESHKLYVRSLLLQVNSRSQVNFIHVQNSVLGRRPAHLLVFKTLHRTSFARYIYSHDFMRVAHNILRSQGDLQSCFPSRKRCSTIVRPCAFVVQHKPPEPEFWDSADGINARQSLFLAIISATTSWTH